MRIAAWLPMAEHGTAAGEFTTAPIAHTSDSHLPRTSYHVAPWQPCRESLATS